MMGFLKRILAKVPVEAGEKKLKIGEVEGWLSDTFNTTIKGDLDNIRIISQEVLDKVEELEKVDVDNKKVEDRLKSMVKGNKLAYVTNTRSFISSIRLPKEVNSAQVLEFCSTFDQNIAEFNKRTMRNYFIMKNLIGDELDSIAKRIKQLDSSAKRAREKVKGERLELYEDVLESLSTVQNAIREEKDGTSAMEMLNMKRKDAESEHLSLAKELERLEQSEDFSKLKQLREGRENLKRLMHMKGNEIVNIFSPLQKAMRKMSKLDMTGIMENYVENPVKALLDDEDLKILKVLEDLNQKMVQGVIELKEGKKKKSIESVGKLKEDYLKKWKESYLKMGSEMEETSKAIGNNTAEYEIDAVKAKVNDARRGMEELEAKARHLGTFDIDEEVKKIEGKLLELTNVKVKVK